MSLQLRADYEVAGVSRTKVSCSGLDLEPAELESVRQVEQRTVSIDYSRSEAQGLKSVGGSQSEKRDVCGTRVCRRPHGA